MVLCKLARYWNIEDNECCDNNAANELKYCNEEREYLIEDNQNLTSQLESCFTERDLKNNQIQQLTEEIDQLKSISPEPNPEIEFWNNKYPKQTILYMGRNFGKTSTMIPIDVKLMITPQDAVIQDIVKQAGLEIQDPETDVPAIYSWLQQYYKYEYDKDSMGLVEHWKFPFETVYALNDGQGSDCDDFALLQASLYIAAGMPSWKVRCVAGLTPGGDGHLTVGVYSEVTKDYRHLNSTYYGGSVIPTELSKYKRSGDPADPLNITDVWFSMNNEYTWSSFMTTKAEKSFKKQKLFEII